MDSVNNSKHANITHGLSHTKIYSIWKSMKLRCYSINHISYKRYGALGIGICDRWMVFENFFSDMGHPPTIYHQIDRINSKGNYEPPNCRWVTPKENSRNTKRNMMIRAFGKSQCASAWSEELGIEKSTISWRIKSGWSPERAVSEVASFVSRRYLSTATAGTSGMTVKPK